jgi:hypothetical protein
MALLFSTQSAPPKIATVKVQFSTTTADNKCVNQEGSRKIIRSEGDKALAGSESGPLKKFYIYAITCKPTGTIYVGKTRDPSRRLKMHRRAPPMAMLEDVVLFQPFEEYFDFEVLAICNSKTEATEAQCILMKEVFVAGDAFKV